MEYASTHNAQRQLAVLLQDYTSYIITGQDPSLEIKKYAIEESQDTCDLIRNGYFYLPNVPPIPLNQPPKGALGYGGNGTVYPLSLRNKAFIQLNSISFNDNRRGGWGISESFAVIKVAENELILTFHGDNRKGGTFTASDLYFESIILALLSILYDGLVSCHIPKIFSTVLCPLAPTNTKGKVHLVMERASYDLHHFLTSPSINSITADHLIIWTIQLILTVYIMKKTYSLVNFDMHIGNILLVDLASEEGKSMVYGNKLMAEVGYLHYHYFGQVIILPTTQWLVKITDFGLSKAQLSKESIKFQNKEYVFHHADRVLFRDDSSTYNTLEINYFIRNLLCILHLEAEYYKSAKAKELLYQYYPFAVSIYPGAVTYPQSLYNVYPEKVVLDKQIGKPISKVAKPKEGRNLIFLQERNWGEAGSTINTHMDRLLNSRIWTYTKQGYLYVLSSIGGQNIKPWNQSNIALTLMEHAYQPDIPRFFNRNLKYARNCVLATGDLGECEDLQEKIEADPLTSTLPQSLGKRLLRTGLLSRGNIREEELRDFRYPLSTDVAHYYFMQINPSLTRVPFLNYQAWHRGLDYKPPPAQLIGKPLPSVRIHLMYLQENRLKKEVKAGFSLFEAAREYDNAIAINGGFFIVGNNVDNYLTPSALDSKIFTPIGFFKNPDIITNQIKIPYPYESDFGIVAITNDNKLELHSYPDFLARNKANIVANPTVYQSVTINESGTVVHRGPYFSMQSYTLNDAPNYQSVFCSGPVLVRQGKVVFGVSKLNELMRIDAGDINRIYGSKDTAKLVGVFNRKLREKMKEGVKTQLMQPSQMLGREQISEGTYYTCSNYQENVFKYYSNVGESKFEYGQRSSNNFQINNAVCRTKDGKLLVILNEGRGYESVGLDRIQFAQLVSKFNIDFALALDTGFSANILVKLGGVVSFACRDPQRRELGASMVFSF